MKYIEDRCGYWAEEFCYEQNVPCTPEIEQIVKMALYTIAYHIADNLRDGELRDEVISLMDEK
jgi:hypothetical protein